MRSLTFRLLLFISILLLSTGAFAHDVTITGTQNFSSLDGSASDHDGAVNGVFTVSDGNLAINGIVNCNDDTTTSACAMAFAVNGNLSVGSTGALFAENRTGGGTGGAITLTVGGNFTASSGSVISTDSKSSSGATGGNITANVSGAITLASGATIDAGSSNAAAGKITLAAGGQVSVNGNVLSGPSRTLLATRLTGSALDGGSANQAGGEIVISSNTFIEPSVVIGSNASIVSQGRTNGAGPVTITGCGIEVRGLVAALSEKESAARVSIRSGQGLVVDSRDLGVTGATLGRNGRVRADAPSGTSVNKGVDLFAAEGVQVLGPAAAASTLYAVSSLPGLHDSKSYGGLIRFLSTGGSVTASGNVIDNGRENSGDTGGKIEISAKDDVILATAVIRSIGDINTNNPNRGGGSISARSYSGNVIWTNGVGEVRPTGSSSGLPTSDQGVINLTACGTVNITGTSFPVMGVPTFVFPNIQTGVCSPAAPSLPVGVPPFVVCNTPPVANDAAASTNEDNSVTITLSGSDADGDPLTFSIVSGPANGTLGAIVPVNSTSATVVYTPNANYNGGDSFVYQANDGNGGTDNATVTITIAPVNDAPSFLAGPTVTSLEDGGAQSIPNWATAISAGPADESAQTVTFTVTNDNPSLFSVQPALASNGTLTYTAAANAYGSANITIVAHDNGGTANGGADTSAAQTSSITVTPVNDAPSFTAGGNVAVGEDSGAYSAAWASGISAGPNEGSQTVSFNTSNSNNGLFSAQPAISPSGVLSFTPAANAVGIATVTVSLSDNGGTANGGVDTSASVTFTITVNAVNDAPSFTSGGNVTVNEDSGAYSAAWATAISAGPADESGQSVTFSATNDNNGLFSAQPSIAPNGTLSFTVAADAFGSANVTVTLSDDGGTANGGVDTSAAQSFTITVTAVNDAPSFVKGADVTVNEDSGAYSAANWATAISAGPNEGSQALTFNVSSSNPALFASGPSIAADGTLSFTPAANANGTATITVTLSDDGGTANSGADTSAAQTFVINVTAVNDAPSFTGGGNVSALEDSAAQTVSPWATAISAGPADEAGQSFTFAVTSNSNPSLFSAGPSIAPDGTLTYTPAANAFGSATITVVLSDNGGTANGGADTSAAYTFTITIDPVNDAPSFTAGGNVSVNEDSGAYSAAWASGISAGPNEAGQTVSFNVSNSNNALFAAQPAISPSGVLTFTPAANAFGTATVTVSLSDNGGTANGGVDTSGSVTFTITINGLNDAPTAGTDSWETEGNTELRVDLAAGLTAHVADTTPSGTGVLDNDADTIEGDPFSITSIVGCGDAVAPFDCTFGDGSKLSMQANGSFSWIPGPGATSGSFQYVVTDNPAAGAPASATGTVNITVHDEIWYVQGGAVGGNGTSVAPFGDFTSLDGGADVDGPGAYIFVHTSTVAGSIGLEANQHLLGEGVGLIINRNLNGNGSPATLVAPGVQPTVTSTGDTVSVDNVIGTEIAGLRLISATGNAIDVTSNPFGGNAVGASIHDNVVAAAGAEGIDVNGGGTAGTTVSVNNTSITSVGNGFNVTSLNDTAVSYSNGTITSTAGRGISIDGSAGGNLFVTGLSNVTVSGNTAGDGIRVQTASFDAIPGGAFNTVNASVTVGSAGNGVGGNGVVLSTVSGDVSFSALTAYADNGAGVSVNGTGLYTGAAGLRVSGGSNAGIVVAANGPAVRVVNATIGASHLTFGSVTATGAVNGILLNNTGTAGGLKVVGLGTPGSGGSIANATGSAVLATSTASLGLAEMTISNPASQGIEATDLAGSSTITNTTITQFNSAAGNGLVLVNTNTNGALVISGSTFSNAPTGNDALSVEARGTSNLDVTVSNASRFTGLSGDGIDARTIVGASGTINLAIRDSQFDTAAPNGNGGIVVNAFGGPATVNLTIERNTFDDTTRLSTNAGVVNITVGDPDGSGPSLFGVISQNTFTRGNGRRAINAIADTFSTLLDLRIDGNNIDRMTKGAIYVDTRNVANANARLTNNRIGQLTGFIGAVGTSEEVVRLQTQNTATMASLVESNIINANTPFEVLRVRAINTSNHSATVRGNTITDGAGAHVEISFQTATAVGVGPTLCANVNGNTLPTGGAGVIQLNEGAGALNVAQASTAAVSTANSNATVTVVGTPQFGVPPCGLPPV